MHKRKTKLLILGLTLAVLASAQDSTKLDKIISFSDKIFGTLCKKASQVEKKLEKQTNKYLSKIERQEERLKKKLWKKDSTLAKELFSGIKEKYDALRKITVSAGSPRLYSGRLDSISTTLNFLQSGNGLNDPRVQQVLDQYKSLQGKLDASEQIRQYIIRRQQYLKEQFSKLGMVKELKQFRKQVYYYQAQVKEYKQLLENPDKLVAKLFDVTSRLPLFQDFFARQSQIGSLFRVPGSNNLSNVSFNCLQTRYSVQQTLSTRVPADASQFLQSQLQTIASKTVSKNNLELPSFQKASNELGFKPNTKKSKSLTNRIEKGGNIHFGRLNHFFPTGADIGLSIGYKINDNGIVGIGTSYKLGFGTSFRNMHFVQQGYTIRSYLNWKLKGSIYLYGGYERIYFSTIPEGISIPFNPNQESGLLGLTKKYPVSKKIAGNFQFLYDLLSYKAIPERERFVFRIGYNF